ncbi:MAG: hypothetical protein Q9193_006087 [Seirophora villosa]
MAWTRGRKFLRKASLGLFWKDHQTRPVRKLRSDYIPSFSLPLMVICEHLVIAYSAIFVAGWNIAFPTAAERLLWRITTLYMLGFGFFGGWLFFFIDILFVRKQQRNPASHSALRTIGQSMAYARGAVVSKAHASLTDAASGPDGQKNVPIRIVWPKILKAEPIPDKVS